MTDLSEIIKKRVQRNQNGFLPLGGGTGLGKNYAKRQVILSNDKRKFIYLANRRQLLDEALKDLEEEAQKNEIPDPICSYQKPNLEHLYEVEFSELIENKIIGKYLHYFETTSQYGFLDTEKIQQIYKEVRKYYRQREEGWIRDQLQEHTQKIYGIIKRILKTAYRVQSDKDYNPPKLDEDDYKTLIQLPQIQQLFPFLEFTQNPTKRVFLVTVQKFFRGCFNGQRNVDFFGLTGENGNYIIFMDEFDFLENELVKLICKDYDIQNPFLFVKLFCDNLSRNKLPDTNFLHQSPWRNTMEKIIRDITSLQTQYQIDYPNICHFIASVKRDETLNYKIQELKAESKNYRQKEREAIQQKIQELENRKIRQTGIFQTRYTVSAQPLFLKMNPENREGSFEITKTRPRNISDNQRNVTAFALLNAVNVAVLSIVRLFKTIENSKENQQVGGKIYTEILGYCYKVSEEYQRTLRLIRQYPSHREPEDHNYEKFHKNGFGFYEIIDLQQNTDPDEIQIDYYPVFTTVENIIERLAQNNLVVAMSATANLFRFVHSTDFRWLKKRLGQNFHQFDDDDFKVLHQVSQVKENRRKNTISLEFADSLDSSDEFEGELLEYIQKNATLEAKFDNEFEPVFATNGQVSTHRKQRVNRFFAMLCWVLKHRTAEYALDTHLLFFTSYRQILYILTKEAKNDDSDEVFIVENKGTENLFEYFTLTMQDKKFNIVFYNARKANEIHQSELNLKKYYSLFWEKVPVILITQYQSAGNGVNLQYYATPEAKEKNEETDFIGLHLLGAPYFYFNQLEKNGRKVEDYRSKLKENIYYLAKLYHAKQLSEDEFQQHVNRIRQSDKFNGEYIKTKDGILNQMSVFIQAIGRIERVRNPMPNQVVRLAADSQVSVVSIFQEYLQNIDIEKVRGYFEPYLSHNMRCILKQVADKIEQSENEAFSHSEQHLTLLNQKCIRKFKFELHQHQRLRNGQISSPNRQKAIRKKWTIIREDVLKHAFCSEELRKLSGVFQTEKSFSSGGDDLSLLLDEERNILPPNSPKLANYQTWNLNSVYQIIKKNEVIRGYFELHKYELGFANLGQFFTPYLWQAVLIGAIGEEATKAIFAKPAEYSKEHGHECFADSIALSDDNESEISDTLFEVADLKVSGHPFYIDCKNYGYQTIFNFPLLDEDGKPLHAKLNEEYLLTKAIEKLQKIRDYHSSNMPSRVKLIYLNLIGDEADTHTIYQVSDLGGYQPVQQLAEGDLIFISGILLRNNPNRYSTSFKTFFKELSNLKNS